MSGRSQWSKRMPLRLPCPESRDLRRLPQRQRYEGIFQKSAIATRGEGQREMGGACFLGKKNGGTFGGI